MKVFAHRGESALFPENSRSAIQNCIDSEMFGVEIDLYQAENNFVVFHDRWLTRILGIQKRVTELTSENLSQIAGRDGLPIPDLEWVINTLAKSNLMLNIELKNIQCIDTFMGKLELFCKKYHFPVTRLLISSFNHNYLAQISRIRADLKLSLLTATHPIKVENQLPEFELYSVNLDMDCISAELIAAYKKLNYKVMVFTVDDDAEIKWLLEQGVDGIFSNDPRQACKIINNLGS